MKDNLKNYYNIKALDIKQIDDDYIIYDENNIFLLYKIDIDDIKYYLNILSLDIHNYLYKFVINKDMSYISNINDNKYVLLSTNKILNEEINIEDIKTFNLNNILIKRKEIDLVDLWSKKLDYLQYQISQFGNDFKDVLNSFSFFIGMGENAITFISNNSINFSNIRMSLSHVRLNYLEKEINFYNPFNIKEDYIIRDGAEYIKSKLLVSDDLMDDVNKMFKNYNSDEIKLFIARLLFPTLYFDELERIIIDKKESSRINIYIDSINNYLNLIKDIYYEIKKDISIDIPSWIIKN